MVPADLGVEDRLVGPITFRVAAWLAIVAAGVALRAFCGWRPAPVAAGVALVLLGGAGGLWRPGGRPVTSWLRPLAGYWRRRRQGRPDRSAEPTAITVEPSAASEGEALLSPARRSRVVIATVVASAAGIAVMVALVLRPTAPPSRPVPIPAASTAPTVDAPSPVDQAPPPDVWAPPQRWSPYVDPFWFDCGC